MEQSLPLPQSSVPANVKVWRNIAAFLLSLGLILNIVNSVVHIYSYSFGVDVIINLLHVGAFGMLAYTAANRPTRNMMYVLIGKQFVWIILVLVSNFVTIFVLPGRVWACWNILNPLLWAYVLSVVLRNNQMTANERGWIGLLFVASFLDLEGPLDGLLQLHFYGDGTGPNYFVETFSNLRIIWRDVWNLMMIVVYFKFARSCAFSGKTQSASPVSETYTPLNKYMAAVVLTTGIVVGLVWVYYEYAAPALRML